MNAPIISILYAQQNSIYNQLSQDIWDITRDATKWPGGNPIIAHPPCRSWGNYKHKSKGTQLEKSYAIHSIIMARLWGGIVEHPKNSHLWKTFQFPKPGKTDIYNGTIININQSWFGHQAEKNTNLYIVGLPLNKITYPLSLNYHTNTIENMSKKQREHTPIQLAKWLISIAQQCNQTQLIQ